MNLDNTILAKVLVTDYLQNVTVAHTGQSNFIPSRNKNLQGENNGYHIKSNRIKASYFWF